MIPNYTAAIKTTETLTDIDGKPAAVAEMEDGTWLALFRTFCHVGIHGGAERPVAVRASSRSEARGIAYNAEMDSVSTDAIKYPTLTDAPTLCFPASDGDDGNRWRGLTVDIDPLLALIAR